jgi:hypothetical protein
MGDWRFLGMLTFENEKFFGFWKRKKRMDPEYTHNSQLILKVFNISVE